MSVINKKPFIKSLLEDLTEEQLSGFQSLINGGGNQTVLNRTLGIPAGNRTNITNSDKGVHVCSLEIGYSLFSGYLVFSEHYCVLLQFTDFQRIQMFNIASDKKSYELINEYLDINELRSELDDTASSDQFGNDANVADMAIALTQVAGSGNDSYTGTPYIKFTPTTEQKAILADDKFQIIKLNLTALGDSAPAPYVWLKRNSQVKISNNDVYQFSCGGEQFWYDNAPTDIAIKNIGNGALVYVPALSSCYISFASVSIPDLYLALGRIGAKLYRHEVSFTEGLANTPYQISFVSTHSTEILDELDLETALANSAGYGYCQRYNDKGVVLGYNSSNSQLFMTYDEEGSYYIRNIFISEVFVTSAFVTEI